MGHRTASTDDAEAGPQMPRGDRSPDREGLSGDQVAEAPLRCPNRNSGYVASDLRQGIRRRPLRTRHGNNL